MKKAIYLIVLLALTSLIACNSSSTSEGTTSSTTTAEGETKPKPRKPLPPREKGYEIVVESDGFADNKLVLAHHYGNQKFVDDTVAVVGNKAVFKGDEWLPGGIYMLVFPPNNTFLEIIIDRDQHFTVEIDTAELVTGTKFEGSEENTIFYENLKFIDKIGTQINAEQEKLKALTAARDSTAPLTEADKAKAKPIQDRIQELTKELNGFRIKTAEEHPEIFYADVIRAMQDPVVPEDIKANDTLNFLYYRDHWFDQIDFSDARLVRTPVLYGKLMQYMNQLTFQHPDSLSRTALDLISRARANDTVFQFVAITLLNKYAKSKIMGQDGVYVAIVEDVYMKGEAFWSDEEQTKNIVERARALSPSLLGGVAPPFTMADVNGKPTAMHDMPGKYMILYFWDYDCGHCKKVTPALAKLYPKYRNKDVSMMTVSINGDIEIWKKKLKEYGLTKAGGVHVQDHRRETGFDSYYDLRSTPRLFILDKDKKILAKQISVEQAEDLLDKFLEDDV